jgi:acetate kinase
VLNKESGLLGVSGVSGDMREILAAIAKGETRAQLAFDIYVHRLCSEIGAMLASLGGLDALVFTAGVGENSPEVRARVGEAFGFLSLKLDAAKNNQSPVDTDISAPNAKVRTLVVKTQEEWEIAKESYRVTQ